MIRYLAINVARQESCIKIHLKGLDYTVPFNARYQPLQHQGNCSQQIDFCDPYKKLQLRIVNSHLQECTGAIYVAEHKSYYQKRGALITALSYLHLN